VVLTTILLTQVSLLFYDIKIYKPKDTKYLLNFTTNYNATLSPIALAYNVWSQKHRDYNYPFKTEEFKECFMENKAET
jgi:hypothetical protein